MPGIWKREQNGRYYVQLGKRQVNLGTDEEAAQETYHRLMLKEGYAPSDSSLKVGDLVKQFLEWSAEQHGKDTTTWYKNFLDDFSNRFKRLRLADLKPHIIRNWYSRDSWSSATRRCACICIKRSIKWAITEGLVSDDPFKNLQKPAAKRRERDLTSEERTLLLNAAAEPFKTFLTALFDSGARPGEVARVTANDFHGDVWILQLHKTAKKTGKPRVIYLTPSLAELCRKMAELHPEGPLFPNKYG
jgi:integrase